MTVFIDHGLYKPSASQPASQKPRHSSEIKQEMERAGLGLQTARELLQRSEEALADATQRLARANDHLALLKAQPGFNPLRSEVKRLVGYDRYSKVLDKVEFQPGIVQQQEEIVAAETKRIAVRKDAVKREEKRLAGVLKGLQSELKLAQELEDAAAGRVRTGNITRKI